MGRTAETVPLKRALVFATNNRHKLEEVQAMLGGNFVLRSLKDIGCEADIPETGDTFRENASLKSRYVYGQFGLHCFSDDSGLEVDALGGRPGIYSARYAGKHGDDQANIEKLLRDLEGLTDRRARFRAVISLILEGKEYFFEGVTEGRIRRERSGAGGFGYDPVFEPEGYPVTFAEMSPEQKNRISHRGRAIEKLTAFLAGTGPAGPIRTGGQNPPGTGI